MGPAHPSINRPFPLPPLMAPRVAMGKSMEKVSLAPQETLTVHNGVVVPYCLHLLWASNSPSVNPSVNEVLKKSGQNMTLEFNYR